MKNILLLGALIIGLFIIFNIRTKNTSTSPSPAPSDLTSEYKPEVIAGNFSTEINNKYFSVAVGRKLTFEKKTSEGVELVEIQMTGKTKEIMGVKTAEVWDRVWLDNILVEDTKDYYAQKVDGDVWYFGEAVDNYENGKIKDHKGSWEAGVDGAYPGIVMKKEPKVGDFYRQEYYKGEAEDKAEVVEVGLSVKVPYGELTDCIKTHDTSFIESTANELKYYCPKAGYVVLEEKPDEGSERLELLRVE